MNSPPQIAPDLLRTGTVLLALLSTALLLAVAALRLGWVRLPLVGIESAQVIAGVALFIGFACAGAATLMSLLLRRTAGARWLLTWCGLLLLGCGAVLMH